MRAKLDYSVIERKPVCEILHHDSRQIALKQYVWNQLKAFMRYDRFRSDHQVTRSGEKEEDLFQDNLNFCHRELKEGYIPDTHL